MSGVPRHLGDAGSSMGARIGVCNRPHQTPVGPKVGLRFRSSQRWETRPTIECGPLPVTTYLGSPRVLIRSDQIAQWLEVRLQLVDRKQTAADMAVLFAFSQIVGIGLEPGIRLSEVGCDVLKDIPASELSLDRGLASRPRLQRRVRWCEAQPGRAWQPVGLGSRDWGRQVLNQHLNFPATTRL